MELFQVNAQLERTLSAKLDELLNFQKSASDRTGLGYDFSSSNVASSSTTVFVSPANNVESKNNDVKTVLANEKIDKGKSILGAPLSLKRKRLKTLGLRKVTTKNLSRRSSIYVIITELLDILDLIATSGQPLNKSIV